MYFRLVDIYLKDREGSTMESYESFYKTVFSLCAGLGFQNGEPWHEAGEDGQDSEHLLQRYEFVGWLD